MPTKAVAFRIPAEQAEALDRKAEEEGLPPSKYLQRIVEMNLDIDPVALGVIDLFSKGLGISGREVIETLLVNYGSLVSAYERAGIKQPSWTIPFLDDPNGKTAKGKELHVFLTARYLQAFVTDKEKLRVLLEELEQNVKDEEERQRAVFTN